MCRVLTEFTRALVFWIESYVFPSDVTFKTDLNITLSSKTQHKTVRVVYKMYNCIHPSYDSCCVP